jgi:hypothetical protein
MGELLWWGFFEKGKQIERITGWQEFLEHNRKEVALWLPGRALAPKSARSLQLMLRWACFTVQ